MATAISSQSEGSTMRPASPTTSGMLLVLPTIVGVPQAIASSGDRPKPS